MNRSQQKTSTERTRPTPKSPLFPAWVLNRHRRRQPLRPQRSGHELSAPARISLVLGVAASGSRGRGDARDWHARGY